MDLPRTFQDSVAGLCGTFNADQVLSTLTRGKDRSIRIDYHLIFPQGDDFKTPEGDVEDNPEDFSNKWEDDFISRMDR